MATDIERVVRRLFDTFDSLDFETLRDYLTPDAQGVDEISRRWLRSMDEIAKYFVDLGQVVSNVHSELRDIHEVEWGDTALVTLWLDQRYVLEGQLQQVSAPTTIALRRDGESWKVALIHSIPLPPED